MPPYFFLSSFIFLLSTPSRPPMSSSFPPKTSPALLAIYLSTVFLIRVGTLPVIKVIAPAIKTHIRKMARYILNSFFLFLFHPIRSLRFPCLFLLALFLSILTLSYRKPCLNKTQKTEPKY